MNEAVRTLDVIQKRRKKDTEKKYESVKKLR